MPISPNLAGGRGFAGLLDQQEHLLLLLTQLNRNGIAAGENAPRLPWEDLRNLEQHVIGQDVARAFVFLTSEKVPPMAQQLQAVELGGV